MLAAIVGAVVGGVVLNNFDVADQPGSRIGAFDEVMTQEDVARKSPFQYTMNRGDFINTLSCEDPLREQVLVRVRDRSGTDVETGFAGVDGRQPRTGGALHADSDPRLQNPIAGHDEVGPRVNDGLVQRM